MEGLANITAAILAGGRGTRLQSVLADRPKGLAPVRGRPFLSYLLDQLVAAGVQEVVFCTGYRGEQIRETFGDDYRSLRLLYSQEDVPLGTAGALRHASSFFKSESVLVMNGDSFVDANLRDFWNWHRGLGAVATMMVIKVQDSGRYGRVQMDTGGHLIGFREKGEDHGPGWINAGIYLFRRAFLEGIAAGGVVSLERDVFPAWIGHGLYAYRNHGGVLDIGTPEAYASAESFFARLSRKRFVLLDRDGTIIAERDYLFDPNEVELIPGAAEALKELQEMGLGLVVVTNQSAIARGFFGKAQLDLIHQRLSVLLGAYGVHLDGIYVCPHVPEDNCSCRKPKPGLVEQAMKDFNFDPKLCFVVGDKACDIELGQRIGAKTLLVSTGYGAQVASEGSVAPDFVAEDLLEAVKAIRHMLAEEKRENA